MPEEFGGRGLGLRAAAHVVQALGTACGSTAMIVTMHFSAVAALVGGKRGDALQEIATGDHLSTLAFSEVGSRSHFWVPMSTATAADGDVTLHARKSWVTSAGEADSYEWSSRPVEAEGPTTLWFLPSETPGLTVAGPFDGLGLRGNASSPVTADGVRLRRQAMLGRDGEGLDLALSAVLPYFLVLCGGSDARNDWRNAQQGARRRMSREKEDVVGHRLERAKDRSTSTEPPPRGARMATQQISIVSPRSQWATGTRVDG